MSSDKVAWAEFDGDGYESDRFVAKSSLSADSESNSPVQGLDCCIRPKERCPLHTHVALGSIHRRPRCEVLFFSHLQEKR